MAACELQVGDHVCGPNGVQSILVATSREEKPNGVLVFNFQVEDFHTYFVAASADSIPILVHNADCAPEPLPIFSRKHGGDWHDGVINDELADALAKRGKDVRKNQALVNAEGQKISNLRPDGQWTDENGVRNILQVVNSNPTTHEEKFRQLIPNAIIKIIQRN